MNIHAKPITLDETRKSSEKVEILLGPSVKLVLGAKVNKEMTGKIRVEAIVTGIKLPNKYCIRREK